MRLTNSHPQLDASKLVLRMHPPHRFENVRFDNYRADAAHPSQGAALASLRAFAKEITGPAPAPARFWKRQAKAFVSASGRYLDGGFGVGKTHLLAGLWHEVPLIKAYTTFAELTAFIGFVGMNNAISALGDYQLLCIDEFELDDVANTLMVVSLLRGLLVSGTRLAVTSNTLPDQLGQQRFSASEFRREIAAIASHFEELSIDGPDFRTTSAPLPLAQLGPADSAAVTHDDFESLIGHLRSVHPVQYGPMLDDAHGVVVEGLRRIDDQDQALLFVQFVDKLYDARIPVSITGCLIEDIFHPRYRNGGYRKKYGRAESRLRAMHAESEGLLDAGGT